MKQLVFGASPHAHSKNSAAKIMLCVLLALLPAAVAGCLRFGINAVLILAAATGSAVLFELICGLIQRRPQIVLDCSAAVTGLLLGMTLPPDLPLWEAVLGSFAAIVIVKQLFGGLGKNFVNPAVTARMILLVTCTSDLHAWQKLPAGSYWDLFLGNTGGCIGEGCALGLLLGAVFLCMNGIISPVTPLSYLGSFALLTYLGGYDVPAGLLSGGLLLGACFMATDYTTTPLTAPGKLLFGIGCGCITYIVQHYGGYPEGTAFAILFMNLLTPLLDRLTRTRPFGAVRLPKRPKPKHAAGVEAIS